MLFMYIAKAILHLLQTYVASPCLLNLCVLVRWLLVISKFNFVSLGMAEAEKAIELDKNNSSAHKW